MRPTGKIPSFGKVTIYRGVTFKSQCEARWAALFDIMGLEWEYEPFGESTFPDFCVGGDWYLEVKGALSGSCEILQSRPEQTLAGEPNRWFDHPDAVKARASAKAFDRQIAIGLPNGHMFILRSSDLDPDFAQSWRLGKVPGQSRYDWDRTLVMVTGRNLL